MSLPRGMKDFEADEMSGIERIRTVFLKTCGVFGYAVVEPSPIEMLSVLEAKAGPAIRDEVYHFEDKGKRAVALRFDLTVGMTRNASAQRSMRLPARHAAFGGVWRYDEPQKGRYRYFHQWDIEIYGATGAEADAEAVEFTAQMLETLGLCNTRIEISHRMIAESYIVGVMGSKDALGDMLRAVDRTQKRSESEIISEYKSKGYAQDRLEKVMRLAHARGTADEAESALGTGGLEGWDELRAVLGSLDERGVKNVEVNLGIVRGLDYYSGVVFEAFDPDSGMGALAGGGRYDSLAESLGGQSVAAVGAAGGVERTMLAMDAQGIKALPLDRPIVVAYADKDLIRHAASLASGLRRAGIYATVDLAGRSLKKQMSNASQDNARVTIIIKQHDAASQRVIVRNMDSQTEKEVKIEEILADPKSALS